MITDSVYFKDNLDRVSELIESYNDEILLLRKTRIHDFTKEVITKKYNNLFLILPYEVETSSSSISISIHAIKVFDLYYKFNENITKLDYDTIIKAKNEFEDKKIYSDDKYIINDFLEEYFHNLTYDFSSIMDKVKQLFFFKGIESETIILQNILNHYKAIVADDKKQLVVFWGISLTKEISDIVTEMLIDVIEQRLLLLNPTITTNNIVSKTTYIDNSIKQIEWLGTQQELCELITELISKKWISPIREGERRKISNSITTFFDLTNTKRNESSKIEDSFYQLFKGEIIEGVRNYPFLDSKRYSRKFNTIENNNH